MIVQIVAEGVNQVDCVIPDFPVCVAGEQHKSDIADVISNTGISCFQLSGGFSMTIKHLRGSLTGSFALFEFLK